MEDLRLTVGCKKWVFNVWWNKDFKFDRGFL